MLIGEIIITLLFIPLKFHSSDMDNRSKEMRNQEGSVLLVTVVILILLTIIGTIATRTTNTELKIATNHRIYKQDFHLAEGAAKLAVQKKINGDYGPWIAASDNSTFVPDRYFKDNSTSNTNSTSPPVINNIDVQEVIKDWDDGTINITPTSISSSNPEAQYIAIADPWTGDFVVIGHSQEMGADVWIEIGVKAEED